MFLMLFSPFWNLTNEYSNIIQFKWRLLGITTILSCISIAIFVKHYSDKLNIKYEYLFTIFAVASAAICIINMEEIISNHDNYKSEYISTIIYNIPESIGGGQEYLPVETDYDYLLENSFIVSTNTGAKTAIAKENQNIHFVQALFLFSICSFSFIVLFIHILIIFETY